MTFERINTYSFKLISFLPIIWILSLYLFLVSCIIDLGHYPVPSLNDPKGIGSEFLYGFVWFGFLALFYGSILWAVNLIIGIFYKKISKKHLIIFSIGLIIVFIQILLDPGNVIYWYLD
ncbi:MAG: hypothetical protein JKY54_05930 [Flavobacteriales bacterium]|nr:hypothetical protein [Flavobacteriales bacterium]